MTKHTILPKTAVLAVLCVLLATPLTVFSQQKSAVPTVHNRALDEKFLKLARDEEEKRYFQDYLSDTYQNCGSYLASAKIQQALDLNIFLEFLDGNVDILKRFDEDAYNKIDRDAMRKVVEKSEPIKQWLNENYFKAYYEPLGQFDHQPEAEEVDSALSDYVENDPNKLFGKMHVAASRYANNTFFDALQKSNMDIVQKSTCFIAYKISTADYLLFKHLLEGAGLYSGYDDRQVLNNFNEFMRVVQPKAQ